MEDSRALFVERLAALGGKARWCTADEVLAVVREAASGFPGRPVAYTDGVSVLLPALQEELRGAGIECKPARTLDDALTCCLALSRGELALAETGSVISAEPSLEGRALSMLSTVNLIVLPADSLVPSLDNAAVWLSSNVRRQPYVSFVTGPSRSADIERSLAIGVQGPREVIVVFVEGDG